MSVLVASSNTRDQKPVLTETTDGKKTRMNTVYPENPFSLEPITIPSQFFGRKSEVRRAIGFLHGLQCVYVAEPVGIGKTSFLLHVAHPQVRAGYEKAQEHIFIQLDGCSLAGFDLSACCLHICQETIQQIKKAPVAGETLGIQLEQTVREVNWESPYFHLNTLFQTADERLGCKLVVSLDNFDALARSSALEDVFFSALRSLTRYDMAYLIASQSPLPELERVRPAASPLFNVFQRIRLKPFAPEESDRLVTAMLESVRAVFPQYVIDHILALGNNEPHRLQRAGHVAFRLWQENGRDLNEAHCEEIERRFEEMEVQDRQYFSSP
jgi:hypothetical protein